MGKLAQFVLHPLELKAAIQFKFFKTQKYPHDETDAPQTLKNCYVLLRKTSRSFAAVIKELNPELKVAVTVFYLVLRALDTVEDDMTLDPKVKIPLLRTFDEKLDLTDWTFNGSGPNEADRCVLVEFDQILAEYHKLRPEYQRVIKKVTKDMGNGMADYINDESFNLNGVATVEDFDLYCYYVAGLVGVGLTDLFLAAKFANEKIGYDENACLTKSMGLFLQKTNIIRDYKEDLDDGRSFWPKEIWGKYADQLKDLAEPQNKAIGLECISEMVLNSLSHAKDVLVYLSLVEEQTSYQFCVIPQVMAIATLELVFQNPKVFEQNVKIRKGETCDLILRARTYKGCIEVFREYIRRIHHKCPVEDRNYLEIGVVCGQLEAFIESLFIEDYMPEGAVAPKHNEIYNDVKYKIQLDKEVEDVYVQETQRCNQILLSAFVVLLSIGYGLYYAAAK